MALKVLVLNPSGSDLTGYMPYMLRGTINALGPFEIVPYVNLPGAANVNAGTETLHTRLTTGRASGETFVVFAYSEGCEVAARWLRVHGTGISPADIEFILIGHPSRKYGGFVRDHGVFAANADVAGFPDATPYRVRDFTRQYDTVSDFPAALLTALGSLVAVQTNLDYLFTAIKDVAAVVTDLDLLAAAANAVFGTISIHNWYMDVTLTDPANISLVEGNVTYIWSPTAKLPMLDGWFWWPQMQQTLELDNRPIVEAAYSRPVSMHPPPPPKLPFQMFRREQPHLLPFPHLG